VFENLLGQAAADQLIADIASGVLAPAMLFSGPPASGKGTAALELGRIISCEDKAAWNCGCPACSRHRLLIHPDLLCLGWRPFSAEIAASAGAFLREAAASRGNGSSAARTLFIRAVRKLLNRFNPVVWEDDAKGAKVAPLVDSLLQDLDELEALTSVVNNPEAKANEKEQASAAKLSEGILKNAFALESEGISETIPIAQIRRAAWWSRLAPLGRGKLLIIENADRMQEEARNSLLKLLEEPPPRLTLVLTSPRPNSLLLTILSRLRPYRFSARSSEIEAEVIRRVFRDQIPERLRENQNSNAASNAASIGAYLDSFLPVSGETLEALAAFFAASAAYRAALLSKRQGRSIADEVVLLGKHCAPRAEAAGLGRPQGDGTAAIALVLDKAGKFEIRSLFSRFLGCLAEQVSLSQRAGQDAGHGTFSFLPRVAYNEIWKECIAWGESAVRVYNLRPVQALEKLFTDLSRRMAALPAGSAL